MAKYFWILARAVEGHVCLRSPSSWSQGEASGTVASGGLKKQGLQPDKDRERAAGRGALLAGIARPLLKPVKHALFSGIFSGLA